MSPDDSRIDDACDRFEEAWRAGRAPAIETYLNPAPPPERPELLRQLLRVELELRREQGENPTIREYLERFSAYPDAARSAFADVRPRSPYGLAYPPAGTSQFATVRTGSEVG